MALEFLLVKFPTQRTVLADDNGVGFTNHLMLLAPDSYRIALDGCGFEPAFQDIDLSGTSAVRPMVLVFNESPGTTVTAARPSRGAQA
jgi:hypothetical protein